MAANKQPKNTQKCRRLTKNSRKMLNYLHMNYVCLWYVYTCHTQTKQTTSQIPMRKVVRQWIWARVIDFRLMDWLLSENEWRVYFTLSLLPAAGADWFMLFCDDKQNNDIQQHILQHIFRSHETRNKYFCWSYFFPNANFVNWFCIHSE